MWETGELCVESEPQQLTSASLRVLTVRKGVRTEPEWGTGMHTRHSSA